MGYLTLGNHANFSFSLVHTLVSDVLKNVTEIKVDAIGSAHFCIRGLSVDYTFFFIRTIL